MPVKEDLSLTRPGPAPVLTKRPRPEEDRPRLFVSWHPQSPKTPLYVYFQDEEYQSKWSGPAPRPRWAFQALGSPRTGTFDHFMGSKGIPMSSDYALLRVYDKKSFAADIASHMIVPPMSRRDMQPFMADVLSSLYYAQKVIPKPALPQSLKPAEQEGEEAGEIEENQVPPRIHKLEASKQTVRRQTAEKSTVLVGGQKRKASTLVAQPPSELDSSVKRRRTLGSFTKDLE